MCAPQCAHISSILLHFHDKFDLYRSIQGQLVHRNSSTRMASGISQHIIEQLRGRVDNDMLLVKSPLRC